MTLQLILWFQGLVSPSHCPEADARRLLWTRTAHVGSGQQGWWPQAASWWDMSCVRDPYQQLHGEPEFWVGTEAQLTSTHPHRDRQVAPCTLLPQLSGSGTPPVPRAVGLDSGLGKLLWCGVVSDSCAVLALCATLLTTHTPLGILTALNFFFLFSPELRQEEEKDVFSLFFLLSLLYLSDLSLWKDTPMLNLCENIDSKNFHFHVHFSPAYKKWVIQ